MMRRVGVYPLGAPKLRMTERGHSEIRRFFIHMCSEVGVSFFNTSYFGEWIRSSLALFTDFVAAPKLPRSSMPKKRAALRFAKPTTPIHPSLASSSNELKNQIASPRLHYLSTPPGDSASVSDQIQRLRQAAATQSSHGQAHGRTGNPSPSSVRPLPELVGGRSVSRPAGPPPPRSWREERLRDTDELLKRPEPPQLPRATLPENLELLPGLHIPEKHTLIYQAMKALAKNWDWHMDNDLDYLSKIPTRYRMALLCFLTRYNPHGISHCTLEALFIEDQTLENTSNNEDLTHLDLSVQIGGSLSLLGIKCYLANMPTVSSGLSSKNLKSTIPDLWDAPSPVPPPHIQYSRFPSLTHLSLSHPLCADWKVLLRLVENLPTLTHLSLAHWPAPSMETSLPAGEPTRLGTVDNGRFAFSFGRDNDWPVASAILRQLSKKTYCLKWLDLTGCCSWVLALQSEGIDWNGAWRKLETVKVGQGWIPRCLKEEHKGKLLPTFEAMSRRTALRKPALLGHENRNEPRALAYWLNYERKVGRLEEIVNRRKSRVARMRAGKLAETGPSVDELVFNQGEFESWWGPSPEAASCTVDSQDDGRGNRVTFERGWQGSWIEDAINSNVQTNASWSL